MKKQATTTILMLVALTLALGGLAADQVDAAAPRAVVPESIKDFGTVQRGDRLAHRFVIRNDGDAILEITEVKPACGCTVAEFDRTIAPGQSGEIRAEVDTSSFRGPIAKSVQVFTNDTTNPKVNLVIKAAIRAAVEAHPGYSRFVAVEGESAQSSSQIVWSSDREDFTVLSVDSPYRFVKVSHREATSEERRSGVPGRQWKVDIALSASAPIGPLADFVVVHTDHPDKATLSIPVSGFVRPILTVTPRIADFGRRELSEPQQASLEIKNLSSGEVSLEEATTDLDGLEAEIEAVEEGRHYMVVLTLKPGAAKGPFEGTLTINTSSNRQPVLEVSVKGVVL
jgi:hypothetical protein